MSTPESIQRDKELVQEAQQNPEAFGALFDLYYATILNYTLRRTGKIDIAEDITAETFLKALKGLPRFTWRGIPFSAWLYRIASNEVNMYFRKSKRSFISLEFLHESGFEIHDEAIDREKEQIQESLDFDEAFTSITKALSYLPLKYQEALALRYMEGKSYEEIANILNAHEGTIRSLISRGITKLKDILQQKTARDIIENERRDILPLVTRKIP